MKICFYTTGDIKSIATMKRALGMADPLAKLGWEVSVIAMKTEENLKRIALESSLAKPYYFNPGNPIKEITQKQKILRQIQPDVVWVCSLGVRNFLISRKSQVFIEHSELGSAIPDNKGFKKLQIQFFEFISVYYSGLILASKYLENYFEKKVKKNVAIHYSPYAYNNEVINFPAIAYDALKDKYANKIVFVYMGTLTRNYGLFSMLEAANKLKEINKNFVLLLLGRGRHFEDAKTYIQENDLEDFVKLLGYVDEKDLSSYFKLANAFISPLNDTVQDWARCPSKVYMYLPYKKPVLTCEIGEPKEIFGVNGYYFNYNKPITLTNLMVNICNRNSFKNTIDINAHSWDTRAKEFDVWYKNAIKK